MGPILSYIHVLKLYIHCCRYRLMGCLNSLFYFLLYNTFIRSKAVFRTYTIVYVCRLSSLMRLLCYCIISCCIRARALVRHYCDMRERKRRIIAA